MDVKHQLLYNIIAWPNCWQTLCDKSLMVKSFRLSLFEFKNIRSLERNCIVHALSAKVLSKLVFSK